MYEWLRLIEYRRERGEVDGCGGSCSSDDCVKRQFWRWRKGIGRKASEEVVLLFVFGSALVVVVCYGKDKEVENGGRGWGRIRRYLPLYCKCGIWLGRV